MKRMLSITILAVILLLTIAPFVGAATKSEVVDQIYNIGSKYGMTSADKVKLERQINSSDVTEEQANALVAKAQAIANVMDEAGVTNYDKLTKAQKDEVKAILVEAAKSLNVTLVFKTKSVEVYKNGKLIETITNTNGKLSYTGNEVNVALIAGIATVIALATVVVVKKNAFAK